ncbi:MAG: hydroxyacylglutathione hydrolase [Pseudomonadota bacterium]
MSFKFVTVPCREDNYAYLVHGNGKTALVDAPEAAPIQAALDREGWSLDEIWITHHHNDHVDGLAALREGAKVRGAKMDAHRLPALDAALDDGDTFAFAGGPVQVFDVSGHTIGHIAYYMPGQAAAFTADSLMALGCGRVFEGTFDQMWASLSKLAALPARTMIYSGHEYTLSNGRFALTIEPDNAALQNRMAQVTALRDRGDPSVPVALAEELETNPFLRAGLDQVKTNLNMTHANDAEVFAEIRRRKDSF